MAGEPFFRITLIMELFEETKVATGKLTVMSSPYNSQISPTREMSCCEPSSIVPCLCMERGNVPHVGASSFYIYIYYIYSALNIVRPIINV